MLTFSFRERGLSSSSDPMTSLGGRRLSQPGQNVRGGFGSSGFCTTWVFSTGSSISILSTDRAENRLLVDNKGVQFTCCRDKNPPDWVGSLQSGRSGQPGLRQVEPIGLPTHFAVRLHQEKPDLLICRNKLISVSISRGPAYFDLLSGNKFEISNYK
jgi:hypothetical protein